EQMSETGARSSIECKLALSLLALGRDAGAEERLAIGQRLGAKDDILDQILSARVRARLAARRGEHDRGEQLARHAIAVVEQTDMLNDHGDALCDLAEVLVLAGSRADAAEELEKALALYEQKGNLVMLERTRTRIADLRAELMS